MFENILTKENVSFKELEQICFKIACEFAKEMLKTIIGEVEYNRRMYINTEEKKCVFLMDEQLEIKGVGEISEGVINLIVDNIKEVSYRACAKVISDTTGISISSVAIWNIIQSLGEQIKEVETKK